MSIEKLLNDLNLIENDDDKMFAMTIKGMFGMDKLRGFEYASEDFINIQRLILERKNVKDYILSLDSKERKIVACDTFYHILIGMKRLGVM